jgi:chaperonin GroEL
VEEWAGIRLVKAAVKKPFAHIVKNAGHNDEVMLEKITGGKCINTGFNALTGKVVNMIDEGIIDPTKVVLSALSNAVSVAGTLLTTEAIIIQDETEDKNPLAD